MKTGKKIKNWFRNLNMRKKMSLAYTIPVFIVLIIVLLVGSHQMLRRIENQTKTIMEHYFLNKIFQEIEVYNSNFRIGLYVPDSAYYADNNYYFYPESSFTELDESGAILGKLENGETVYVILQDKSSDPDSVCDYLACLSTIEVTNEDGMTSSYIIKTEVQVNVFEEILDSASMTQNSLLYLTGEDTEI